MESDKRLLFKNVIEYFAIAAIAVQAVFAAFWLFKNIGVLQSDYVAETYILAAESLKVDDSMGILYALLVRALGHGAVLKVFQILVGSASMFFFSLTAFEKKPGIIISMLIALNPLVLQAETAVSPNALVVACALVAIAAIVRVSAGKIWIGVFFAATLAAGFLHPDYAYLFFAVSALYLIIASIVRRKFDVVLAIACVLAFLIPALVNVGIRDDYAYGRVHRSTAFLALQRTAWPKMNEYAGFIGSFEEYGIGHKSGTDYVAVMREADKIPENLSMVFANKFEKTVGYEHAQTSYWQLAQYASGKGYSYWGKDTVRDEILYMFSPLSATVLYLKQKTDTSVPSGLDFLFRESPKAFKIYYLFSAVTMFLFTLMYVVKFLGERAIGKKEPGVMLGFALVGMILLLSLYATFCGCSLAGGSCGINGA